MKPWKNLDEEPGSLLSLSDLKLTKRLVILHTSQYAVLEAAIFAPSKQPCANGRTSAHG